MRIMVKAVIRGIILILAIIFISIAFIGCVALATGFTLLVVLAHAW